jgi:hypothetical protein
VPVPETEKLNPGSALRTARPQPSKGSTVVDVHNDLACKGLAEMPLPLQRHPSKNYFSHF